jgi:hypothetical protein
MGSQGAAQMVFQVIGTVAVIFSILFAAVQLRYLARQTGINNAIRVTQTYASHGELLNYAYAQILKNPALRAYFHEGKECVSDDPLRREVLTIAEMMADAAEYGLLASEIPGSEQWQAFPRSLLKGSPAVR